MRSHAVALYFMAGISLSRFQWFPVVRYNESLRLTTGLLYLTGGRMVR